MKTLTLQFVLGFNWLSRLIAWKNDARCSHVNAVMPDGRLFGALMDGGVQIRPALYDKWKVQIFVTIPVTDEQYQAFWDDAMKMVGQKYDRAGIVGIALGLNLSAPGQSFCSEAITRLVNQNSRAKIVRIAKDPSKIDPDTLRMVWTAIPGAQERSIGE